MAEHELSTTAMCSKILSRAVKFEMYATLPFQGGLIQKSYKTPCVCENSVEHGDHCCSRYFIFSYRYVHFGACISDFFTGSVFFALLIIRKSATTKTIFKITSASRKIQRCMNESLPHEPSVIHHRISISKIRGLLAHFYYLMYDFLPFAGPFFIYAFPAKCIILCKSPPHLPMNKSSALINCNFELNIFCLFNSRLPGRYRRLASHFPQLPACWQQGNEGSNQGYKRSKQCLISVEPKIKAIKSSVFSVVAQYAEHIFGAAKPCFGSCPGCPQQQPKQDQHVGGEAPVHVLTCAAKHGRPARRLSAMWNRRSSFPLGVAA